MWKKGARLPLNLAAELDSINPRVADFADIQNSLGVMKACTKFQKVTEAWQCVAG